MATPRAPDELQQDTRGTDVWADWACKTRLDNYEITLETQSCPGQALLLIVAGVFPTTLTVALCHDT